MVFEEFENLPNFRVTLITSSLNMRGLSTKMAHFRNFWCKTSSNRLIWWKKWGYTGFFDIDQKTMVHCHPYVCSLDAEKAFDSCNWDILFEKLFYEKKLPLQVVKVLKSLYTKGVYQVNYNGKISYRFRDSGCFPRFNSLPTPVQYLYRGTTKEHCQLYRSRDYPSRLLHQNHCICWWHHIDQSNN